LFFIKGDLILRDLLIKQITHLNIDIKYEISYVAKAALQIFELILSLCKNLTIFNFGDMIFSRKRVVPLDLLRSGTTMSSTLIKLKVNVENFYDLLYILDGRFDCLSTLIVSVSDPYAPTVIHGIVSIIS
jgi:hypothetical protein